MIQALLVLPAKIAQHVLLESTNRHLEMHCVRAVRRIPTRFPAARLQEPVCVIQALLVLPAKIAQHVLLESTNRHLEIHCVRAVRRIPTRFPAARLPEPVCVM